MAPVQNLYRLVFGGRLFEQEQWTCSLHLDGDVQNAHAASAFQTALADWVNRGTSYVSSAAHLDFIKFNRVVPFVLPNGKTSMRYAEQDTNEHFTLDMAAGAAGTPALPQSCIVVSLRTQLARGRAHAGRIYVPMMSLPLDPDGRLSSAIASQVAVSAATLVREINAVVAADGTTSVVVFSNIGQVVQNVTTVSVGRVCDTMRSRRTSLPEDPIPAPVNP